MRTQFNEMEIPYDQLRDYGIKKEMFLDLPKQALKLILNGRPSPLLRLRTPGGAPLSAKVRLTRDESGHATFRFIPRRKVLDLQGLRLSAREAEALRMEEVILKDGKFMRLDKETNQVMEMKLSDKKIDKRLNDIVNAIEDVHLGENQREHIKNGKPVTISRGDTQLTIGIDMNSTSGIRVIKGGMDEWRQKMMVEWDRITPGVAGYWQTTQNGWEYTKEVEKSQGRDMDRTGKERHSSKHSYGMSLS